MSSELDRIAELERTQAEMKRQLEALRPRITAPGPIVVPRDPFMSMTERETDPENLKLGALVAGDVGLRNMKTSLQMGGGEAELERRQREADAAPSTQWSGRPGVQRQPQHELQIKAADRLIDEFEQQDAES